MRDVQLFEPDFDHWREGAACHAVPEISFFPAPDDLGAVSLAKSLCNTCPVVDECLAFAIETRQPDGIWGGMTPKERNRLRRSWLDELRRAS